MNDITIRKPRVLVVEDDDAVRRSMQLLLQGRGFDVRAYAAADPMLLDDNLTDAVCLVTDYRLSGRDGIGVLSALRIMGWPGPAILVTAYPTPDLRHRAREVGFSELLEKPFKDHALINAVSKLTGPGERETLTQDPLHFPEKDG